MLRHTPGAVRAIAVRLQLGTVGIVPICGSNAKLVPGMRSMSIMERYRKVRPAPEPPPRPWDAPPGEALLPELPRGDEPGPQPIRPSAVDIRQEGPLPPPRPPSYRRVEVPSEALVAAWEKPVQPTGPRTLRVGLAGPPNSGKSSLMNAILGCPLSAVSPKVDTTRDHVRGVKTIKNTQLVFLDVPGIIPSHQRAKHRELALKAWDSYEECDLCLLIIDVVKRPQQDIFDIVRKICPQEFIGRAEVRRRQRSAAAEEEASGAVRPSVWLPRPARTAPASDDEGEEERDRRPPVTLVLNKIDKASEFRWVQSREREFRAHGHFEGVFYISAKKCQGLQKLLEHLLAKARPRPWTYPAEVRTTLSYVDQLRHQIDTHLFAWFNSDVPYKIEHQTIGWTPRLDGSLLIEHELVVQDSVVARMVLGVRNTIIARLRDHVSHRLRKLWGMPVEVQIWVRALKQRLSRRDKADRGERPMPKEAWRAQRAAAAAASDPAPPSARGGGASPSLGHQGA